jgi:putative tryptophan/tyrosine transport system substrate-binding protein
VKRSCLWEAANNRQGETAERRRACLGRECWTLLPLTAFRRRLGWVEGTTIVVERKEADGHFDRLPALAADLVRSKPDLIVAFAPQSTRAARDATSEIPVGMLVVADPVGMGLASSLARPGGNLTGVATLVPGNFIGKTLGILRELLPHAKRVAALINPSNEVHRLLYPREAPPAAATLGFQLDAIEVREAEEIPSAIAAGKAEGAEALYILGDAIFNSPPNRVPDLAAQARLPSIYLASPRELVQAGGLISYGPDYVALARRRRRPNKKKARRWAPLDAAHLYAKRNGTSRRGKPWRLLRMPPSG